MVREIKTDSELNDILSSSEGKLVVIDFFATWCGPCVKIAPFIEGLSHSFKDVIFLKIDVDGEFVQDSIQKHEINCMPTFVFLKNGAQIDRLEGASEEELTEKMSKLA